MKNTGLVMLLLAVLFLAAGITGLVVGTIRHDRARRQGEHPREVARMAMTGDAGTLGPVTVDTTAACKVGIAFGISGRTRSSNAYGNRLLIHYRVPASYTVRDESGAILHEQSVTANVDNCAANEWEKDTWKDYGGFRQGIFNDRVESRFDGFAVPPPGRITVTATVGHDGDDPVRDPVVILYDQTWPKGTSWLPGTAWILAGLVSFSAAAMAVLLGLILLVLGLVLGRRKA